MKWPLEFSDLIAVGNPKSQVAIITLWTKKEKILEKLTEEYASVGQLYSPDEGINSLIRNLLANKNIRDLILVGADLSRSGEALTKFFNDGIDKDHKIVGMENLMIDEEIPKETIDELRKNVQFHDKRDLKDFSQLNEIIVHIENKSSWGDAEIYPKKQIKPPETYPSEKAGFVVREKYIYEAWIRILNMVMIFGANKESQYAEMQKELISFTAVVEEEDPEDPKLMHCFDFSKDDLERYYPQVLSPQKIEGIEYTYGQRLMDHKGVNQIEKLIERLKKVSHTRRAIAFTWDVEKDYDNDRSPCLNMVHALVQDGSLFLTAYFRSNDMYGAWPRNAFALRKLQKKISGEVGVKMGPLITISNSAHIYKSSWKKAQAVLEHFSLPPKRIGDPRGNIIIRTDGEEIVMVREGPDGKRVSEIRAKSAFEAYHKLSAVGAVSEMSHAFYLGTELAKAEKAIKEKKDYLQDN